MGKRSNFPRVERDFYSTPSEAVEPLLPHLPAGASFVEPCAGDGALVEHLAAAGHPCTAASDIEPRRSDIRAGDALALLFHPWASDFIITNPPWSRPLLHAMIRHFAPQRPTWLLFDADWIHTRQSAPFMPLLRKVVSVGRVKWIPGSKMSGKDNCAWHLFDARAAGDTIFIGRAE